MWAAPDGAREDAQRFRERLEQGDPDIARFCVVAARERRERQAPSSQRRLDERGMSIAAGGFLEHGGHIDLLQAANLTFVSVRQHICYSSSSVPLFMEHVVACVGHLRPIDRSQTTVPPP